MTDQKYHVLAYYFFTPIENPRLEVSKHLEFLKSHDIRCRVYISEEGINGQMSASIESSLAYQKWLQEDPRFSSVIFKIHTHTDHAFPRPTVKYRKQLVGMDESVDIRLAGEHVPPEKWKQMIEERDENTLIIDTRNDYEWQVGHFDGAELINVETFRQFPQYARDLKTKRDPKSTKVMMYCTGGIRCEIYSALMKQEGFENVYQLEGGIINYGLKQGHDVWKGKLFVFDDRLTVPIDETNEEVISRCFQCGVLSDFYFNCANMDCNKLFLCCHDCASALQGCCSEECREAPRLRVYTPEGKPKPFRRKNVCPCTPAAG